MFETRDLSWKWELAGIKKNFIMMVINGNLHSATLSTHFERIRAYPGDKIKYCMLHIIFFPASITTENFIHSSCSKYERYAATLMLDSSIRLIPGKSGKPEKLGSHRSITTSSL